MSNIAHRAFAPSESSFASLTQRLLALRAEIDAILAELASQAMAMQQAEATIAAPVLCARVTDEPAPEGHGLLEGAEAASELVDENVTGEVLNPAQIVSIPGPERPIADVAASEPIEVERETA